MIPGPLWTSNGVILETLDDLRLTFGHHWDHLGSFWSTLDDLGPLLSTIGVIFEHLEFKTSEGDNPVGKVHFLVSYWNAQGPFGLMFTDVLWIPQKR